MHSLIVYRFSILELFCSVRSFKPSSVLCFVFVKMRCKCTNLLALTRSSAVPKVLATFVLLNSSILVLKQIHLQTHLRHQKKSINKREGCTSERRNNTNFGSKNNKRKLRQEGKKYPLNRILLQLCRSVNSFYRN